MRKKKEEKKRGKTKKKIHGRFFIIGLSPSRDLKDLSRIRVNKIYLKIKLTSRLVR